jgi:tetratricopeptide (TPR) repeat protein
MPDELKTAERLMESAPDSALSILQHLSPDKYKSSETHALYGVLLMQALDKKHLPLQPDSLLDFSIQYYLSHPDGDRLPTCYYFKGRNYKNHLLYDKAANSYLKALDELAGSDNNLLLGKIHFDLGSIYSLQTDYVSARRKFQLANSYFKKSNSQVQSFYALLFTGRTYHLSGEYLKAENYYRKLIPQAKDSMQMGTLLQEIGSNFYESKQLDSALNCYRQIVNYPYLEYNRALRYSVLAKIYFDLNKPDSAYKYASESFKYNPEIRTQRESYRIMTNCEFAKGHLDKVTLYMNKYVQLGDSIRKIDAQIKGSYIESLHDTRMKAAIQKNWIFYLVLLIISVSISAFLFINGLHNRSKKAMQQSEVTLVQQKIDIRNDIMLGKRTAVLEKIAQIKSEQSSARKIANQLEREEILKKMYEELLHLNDMPFFFNEMDTMLNNLVSKLRNRYKALNDKELCWCCFFLLKIPTHDMLILLDYKTDNSLKRMKNRLAEKMHLDNATMLSQLLLDVLTED